MTCKTKIDYLIEIEVTSFIKHLTREELMKYHKVRLSEIDFKLFKKTRVILLLSAKTSCHSSSHKAEPIYLKIVIDLNAYDML